VKTLNNKFSLQSGRIVRHVQITRRQLGLNTQSYVNVPCGTQAMMLISSISMPLVNVRITLVP